MFRNRKNLLLRTLDPSFLLAAVFTAVFYWLVFQPSMRGTLLYHYTTEHVVEFVIVALFIWGIIDITLKVFSFPIEFAALRRTWIPARVGREPVANAKTLLEQVNAQPRWARDAKMGKRLVQALEYITHQETAEEYGEHLQYLSDQEEDHTQSNYSLVRFIIAVSPILGLLGTVVHFGAAMSGLSFDELTSKLPTLLGEMGTAFNTTTVALTTTMTMMFAQFMCERVERGIVHSVDRFVQRELANRFEVREPEVAPFLSSIQFANQQILQEITATLQRQVELWTRSLDTLFLRFSDRQQQELSGWNTALEVLQRRFEEHDKQLAERLRQSVAVVESGQERHVARIQESLDKVAAWKGEVAELTKAMTAVANGEGNLVALQTTLNENLRMLQDMQWVDDAIHGLTAAIQLLATRQSESDAPQRAAA